MNFTIAKHGILFFAICLGLGTYVLGGERDDEEFKKLVETRSDFLQKLGFTQEDLEEALKAGKSGKYQKLLNPTLNIGDLDPGKMDFSKMGKANPKKLSDKEVVEAYVKETLKLSPNSARFEDRVRAFGGYRPRLMTDDDLIAEFKRVAAESEVSKKIACLIALNSLNEPTALSQLEAMILGAETEEDRDTILYALSSANYPVKPRTLEGLFINKESPISISERSKAFENINKMHGAAVDELLLAMLRDSKLANVFIPRAKILDKITQRLAKEYLPSQPTELGKQLKKDEFLELMERLPSLQAPGAYSPQKHELYTWMLHEALRQNKSLANDPDVAKRTGAVAAAILAQEQDRTKIKEPLHLVNGIPFDKQSFAAFETGFKEGYFKKPKIGTCEAACDIAKKVAAWSQATYFAKPDPWWDKKNKDGWTYGLGSLGALFLAKAAGPCPEARAALAQYADFLPIVKKQNEAMLQESVAVTATVADLKARLAQIELDEATLKRLDEFANKSEGVHPSDQQIINPLNSYGNMFYGLFLNELQANPSLKAWSGKLAAGGGAEQEAIVNRMQNNLKYAEDAVKREHNGSLWHTYLVAASAISTSKTESPQNARAMQALRYQRNLNANPCAFEYEAKFPTKQEEQELKDHPPKRYEISDDEKASRAPRSVTANFALYLDNRGGTRTKEEMKQDRDSLFESLRCFDQWGWKSVVQKAASEYHSTQYAHIGAHYFHPNLPYVVEAIQALKHDPDFEPKKRADLNRFDENLQGHILGDRNDDDSFRRMGSGSSYKNSPAYINPFIGLALLPYCKNGPNPAANYHSVMIPASVGPLGTPHSSSALGSH